MTGFTPAAYRPADRADVFELMRSVGRSHIDDAEFDWWFERNPVSPGLISLAHAEGRIVGMAAMSSFRMLLGGVERRVAVPVHVATAAGFRRRGVFSALELRNEDEATAAGAPVTITFPNAASHRVFVRDLGWRDLPGRRLWARPLHPAAVARYVAGRSSGRGGLRPPSTAERTVGGLRVRPLARFGSETDGLWRLCAGEANQFVRDAAFLNWRYADSPRDYRRFAAYRAGELLGFAVLGHTHKHGLSAGFVADLVAREGAAVRALLRRCRDELAPGTDAVIALPPPGARGAFAAAGFAPTHKRIRFVGKPLAEPAVLDSGAAVWHFTLGDFDFF